VIVLNGVELYIESLRTNSKGEVVAYNKDQVIALADAVYALLESFRDGVGMDDIDEAVGVLTAAASAADEIKTDFDAAGLHMLGRLGDKFGDARVNPVAP